MIGRETTIVGLIVGRIGGPPREYLLAHGKPSLTRTQMGYIIVIKPHRRSISTVSDVFTGWDLNCEGGSLIIIPQETPRLLSALQMNTHRPEEHITDISKLGAVARASGRACNRKGNKQVRHKRGSLKAVNSVTNVNNTSVHYIGG